MGLNANALCSLDDVKSWGPFDPKLATPAFDEIMADCINVASDQIEQFLRRSLAAATVTDALDGTGTSLLSLSRPPVTSVTSVTEGGRVLDASEYQVDSAGSGLIRIGLGGGTAFWTPGRSNIVVVFVGGFSPIPTRFRHAARLLAYAYLVGKGRDPQVQQERGAGIFVDRGDVEPFSGLPMPVWRLIKSDRRQLLDAVGTSVNG